MALHLAYDDIGKGFVQQYYGLFDDALQRSTLVNMYNNDSFMTFEGIQIKGVSNIMEKLNSLSFKKIGRVLTAVDSQPTLDGGVLIHVLGRLKTDDDPPHAYSQIFVLKPLGGSFYCQHDIFRLVIHETA
ncbi:probable nuclear transport factor 2 isoform X1 [Diachasma alloeum]|uniref:probable nuclear transport factor 2 isoform X1 n=1 Tax=Diachasma alloeum TaxID=454923 RepID=UPI0007384D21|nr:probable nuclear transport factor 2 isoform X1 [Diachasma alloeum]XP_015116747.1 probable nuclear transport factor 2 isoform X1 [Diachasma alloeum]